MEFASNSFFSSYVKISDKEGHAVESILTEDYSNQGWIIYNVKWMLTNWV